MQKSWIYYQPMPTIMRSFTGPLAPSPLNHSGVSPQINTFNKEFQEVPNIVVAFSELKWNFVKNVIVDSSLHLFGTFYNLKAFPFELYHFIVLKGNWTTQQMPFNGGKVLHKYLKIPQKNYQFSSALSTPDVNYAI